MLELTENRLRNILVVAFGGRGDVYPLLTLAQALRERGHRVLFASNPYFELPARERALEFAGYGSAEALESRMRGGQTKGSESPLLRALPGAAWATRGIAQWRIRKRVITTSMRWVYQLIEERCKKAETIVVAQGSVLGARIAQDKLGVPVVTVHLQPAILRSNHDAPGLPLPEGDNPPSRALRRILWASIDWVADRILMPEVNAFRQDLGLPLVRRPFAGWIHSPELVLGLFPDWFAPPMPDWPPNTHLVGFPLLDDSATRELPTETTSFLTGGTPPLVFTVGSFARRSRRFFEVSVEICTRMKRRGLLIAPARELVPAELPETVRYFNYVPLAALLRHAGAIVHHGGIGTTALALAAGIPQLVVPFADDQSDNAARVQRLGAGLRMSREAYRTEPAVRALVLLMSSGQISQACRCAAERIARQPSLLKACRLIEQLGINRLSHGD